MPARRTQPLSRTAIVDAAIALVGREGIAALTTTALARELGVSSGAPFRHFASREDILGAVGDHMMDQVENAFPPADLPPLERLTALFLQRLEIISRHGTIPRLIFSDQFLKALPEASADRIRAFIHRTRAFVFQALAEGRAQGVIRQDIPVEHLMVLFVGTLLQAAFLPALNVDEALIPSVEPRAIVETIRILLAPPAHP